MCISATASLITGGTLSAVDTTVDFDNNVQLEVLFIINNSNEVSHKTSNR